MTDEAFAEMWEKMGRKEDILVFILHGTGETEDNEEQCNLPGDISSITSALLPLRDEYDEVAVLLDFYRNIDNAVRGIEEVLHTLSENGFIRYSLDLRKSAYLVINRDAVRTYAENFRDKGYTIAGEHTPSPDYFAGIKTKLFSCLR